MVDVFEGWLGVVVLGRGRSPGVVRWGAWVPRFALITGVVGLLGIAAINPDAWIARHNIERYEETGKIDVDVPRDPVRRRRPALLIDAARSRCGRRPWAAATRPTTTGSPGTSAAGAPPSTSVDPAT